MEVWFKVVVAQMSLAKHTTAFPTDTREQASIDIAFEKSHNWAE